jgi:hypothetical protein
VLPGLLTDVETSLGEMVLGTPEAAARRGTVGRRHPEQANEAERRRSSERGKRRAATLGNGKGVGLGFQ